MGCGLWVRGVWPAGDNTSVLQGTSWRVSPRLEACDLWSFGRGGLLWRCGRGCEVLLWYPTAGIE